MTWKDPEKWQKMIDGTACPFCKDIHLDENRFSFKVFEFPNSIVRLPKNQYKRGWTVVALKRHATELYELEPNELAGFFEEVAMVAKALKTVFDPVKLNYSIFGNLCPHVHCHVIPQYMSDDPHAPIKMDEAEVLLTQEEYWSMIDQIKDQLVLNKH